MKGKDKVKCSVCNGEGIQHKGYNLRTCKSCGGKGFISRLVAAERALARFSQPRIYKVSYEHSVILRYEGYCWDEIIMALKVLAVSGLRCELIFPI